VPSASTRRPARAITANSFPVPCMRSLRRSSQGIVARQLTHGQTSYTTFELLSVIYLTDRNHISPSTDNWQVLIGHQCLRDLSLKPFLS
jgi:hypothetical protein